MGEKYSGTYVSIFVAGHPLPYNKGPVSMTCTVAVDVTGVTQKVLHLVFPKDAFHYLSCPCKRLGTQFPLARVLGMP